MTTEATTEAQRRMAELYREKLELQDRLNVVTHEIEELQEPLLNYFADLGMEHVKIDGVTLYIESVLWANAKPGDMEQACASMRSHGMEQFVKPTFNVQTLSSYVRELARKDETLPEAVLEHVDVTQKVTIRGRRS